MRTCTRVLPEPFSYIIVGLMTGIFSTTPVYLYFSRVPELSGGRFVSSPVKSYPTETDLEIGHRVNYYQSSTGSSHPNFRRPGGDTGKKCRRSRLRVSEGEGSGQREKYFGTGDKPRLDGTLSPGPVAGD